MDDIKELKNGSQETFNEVYYAYHQQLYNYILSRTTSAYFAEEVVQLTFIKLWNSRRHLSEDIDLNVQLFRIAKTTLIDFLRKTHRENNIVHISKDREAEAVNDIYKNVFYKETNSRLEKLVASLPPVRRKIFEMSRYREMSHKEISEQLSIAPKTVENHINLALKYIKTFFWVCLLFIGMRR